MAMSGRLRLLILEDSKADAELQVAALEKAGYQCAWELARGRDEFCSRLRGADYDLILAEHRLPGFDGCAALQLVRAEYADLPFVLILGAHGEDAAAECLRRGATDYVPKARLERLAPIVERALREKEERRKRAEAEETVRKLSRAVEQSPAVVIITDTGGNIEYVNPRFGQITGYSSAEVLGKNPRMLKSGETPSRAYEDLWQTITSGGEWRGEFRNKKKNGELFWVSAVVSPIRNSKGVIDHFVAVQEDTTEFRRVEEERREEAGIETALALVGQVLIAELDSPNALDQLCRVTAEVLECDTCHTLLWLPAENAYVQAAAYRATPGEREIARVLRVPKQSMASLLPLFDCDDVAEVGAIPEELSSAPQQGELWGRPLSLCMALRRGKDIIAVHTATNRHSVRPFTAQQMRIARGIAQLASLAMTHAQAVKELDRANELKADFIATISHELRTPLQAIIGYQDLLLAGEFGDLAPKQARPLRELGNAALELLKLVNGILNLSRLETHRSPLELSEIGVGELFASVENETRHLRSKTGVAFVFQAPSNPVTLYTDPAKLEAVLTSLVANAFKFTDRGSVTMSANCVGGGVEFQVIDTGIGIAPEAQSLIFEPFCHADVRMSRRHGGMGLGLYSARRLLELLKGKISLESQAGRGSTFRAWVPTSVQSSAKSPPRSAELGRVAASSR